MFRISRTARLLALVPLALVTQVGTAGPPTRIRQAAPFDPGRARHLAEFGAAGDGRADDGPVLERAFAGSDRYCLDGDNRTYAVSGSVRASRSLCLRNATLMQIMEPVDTAKFIKRRCPLIEDASAIIDCGDPAIPASQVKALARSLGVRTLFIRPQAGAPPIEVNLENVRIRRGTHPEAGSRSESAAIWLQGASRVDLTDVEISGSGKGYGLLIDSARNVTLKNVNIHDMVFSPYEGDPPLNRARTEAVGWNRLPIHEFRMAGQDGAKQSKFYGVRIQEQVTCGLISRSRHVVVYHVTVSRCLARFDTGDLPWQTDGLDIGATSSDILITGGTRIDSAWEGMDIVADGDGTSDVTLDHVTVINSFSFGLKLGYALSNVRIIDPVIDGAGLGGIIVYGPVKKMMILNPRITDVGWIDTPAGPLQGWSKSIRSGISIAAGTNGKDQRMSYPDAITIRSSSVKSVRHPGSYEFGYSNTHGTNTHLINSTAAGFLRAPSIGF